MGSKTRACVELAVCQNGTIHWLQPKAPLEVWDLDILRTDDDVKAITVRVLVVQKELMVKVMSIDWFLFKCWNLRLIYFKNGKHFATRYYNLYKICRPAEEIRGDNL